MKALLTIIFTLIILENIMSQTKQDIDYENVKIRDFPVAVQCWTFRKFSFLETLDKVNELGVKYLEAYPGQKINPENDFSFGIDMTDNQISFIKEKLNEYGITLVNFGVINFDKTEEATRKVFEFARKMGIKVIVTEPSYDDYSIIEKMVKAYDIKVAIHNHPPPTKYANPEIVLNNIQNLDKRIGACADTGHWLRTGLNPVEALKLLTGRIINVHLKDLDSDNEDVPFGSGRANIHDILAELTKQNYRGTLTVEHERESESGNPSPPIRKGLEYINQITYYKDYTELIEFCDGKYHKKGWDHHGPGYFELDEENGVLTSDGGMGLFWYSAKKFGNFILDLEFKSLSGTTNSGIFLRVPEKVTSDEYIFHSFEIQIDDDNEEPKHRTGAVFDAEPVTENAFYPTGVWNHYSISFIDDVISVNLNGTNVINWKAEPRGKIKDFAAEGYIGLQNHDSLGKVSFRNIFIKEL